MSAELFEYDGRIKQEGGQQFLSGRGLFGDGSTNIRRIQQHGFYSSPPAGSQGLRISPNGNPDEAYLFGIEHHDHQPTGIPIGGTAIYDANGNIIKMVGDGLTVDMQSNEIIITSGNWTVTAPTLTINANMQLNGNLVCSGTIIDGDGNNGA
jgi:phage baseplate assembly protein V